MIVRVYSRIELLSDNISRFIQKNTEDKFFFNTTWFKNLIDTTIGKEVSLRFYVVEDKNSEESPRCVFPARAPANHRGSILRFHRIGQNSLSGITSNKTILFSPIFSQNDPNLFNIFQTLAKYLYLEKPRWELIDFSALDIEEKVLNIVKKAFSSAGYFSLGYRSYSNWYEPVESNFQEYLKLLPSRNRKAIKNYIRKYKNLNLTNRISIVLYDDPEDIERAINDYETVYKNSWKDEDTNSLFIPKLIRSAFITQKIRLMILYFDQNPAAVELAFLHGNSGILYRTAYIQKYAKYSLGSIIILKMIEYLLNVEHVSEIDFGRDDESYKKMWVTRQRFRKGLIAYNLNTFWGIYGYLRCCVSLFRDFSADKVKPIVQNLIK